MHVLYYQNETVVELTGLTNVVSGLPIDDAAVEITVTDRSGNEILGASWPLAMASLVNGEGDYRGFLPAALETTVGQRLWANVVVTVGGVISGSWAMDLVVERRGAGDRI
jgi:hypothetical protein